MYAQVSRIKVGLDKMPSFRAFVNQTYIPELRSRAGFKGALLLEQIDDRDSAELIVLWENQQAVEALTATGTLSSSIQALTHAVASGQLKRDSYVVTEQDGILFDPMQAAGV